MTWRGARAKAVVIVGFVAVGSELSVSTAFLAFTALTAGQKQDKKIEVTNAEV